MVGIITTKFSVIKDDSPPRIPSIIEDGKAYLYTVSQEFFKSSSLFDSKLQSVLLKTVSWSIKNFVHLRVA